MWGWRSRRASRWSPVRFAWRSAVGHRRGQALALVAVSALITACTAFAPVYDRAMQQAVVDTLLAHASPAEKSVTVVSEALVDAGGETDARDPRDLQDAGPARRGRAGSTQPVLGRSAIVTPVGGEVPPTGPLVWRDGFCEHVRLLERRLSRRARRGPGQRRRRGQLRPVPRLDPDGRVGGRRAGRRAARGGRHLCATRHRVVAGAARWSALSSVFGGTDPSATHDAWLTTEETFVEAPVLTGETSQVGALVRTEDAGVDEVLTLGARVAALAREVRAVGQDLHVDSDLEAVTDSVRAQTDQAHRTVPLLMAPMAVLTRVRPLARARRSDGAAAQGGRRRAAPRPRASRRGRPAARRAAPAPPAGRRAGSSGGAPRRDAGPDAAAG